MSSSQMSIEQAWNEYKNKLFLFIKSRVNSVEDAEDLLNEVFVSLIKKTSQEKSPENIVAWLYRVTRNKIIDYYRTKKRFEDLPEDLISVNAETNIIAELSNCILPMIKSLPETYQQVLILSEIEGKKNKIIANELDLSLSAVKSRILRGREKIHSSIESCCSISRNSKGIVIDYEPISNDSCMDCDNN